jgi:pyridoxal biosynthesis lyase PdxS
MAIDDKDATDFLEACGGSLENVPEEQHGDVVEAMKRYLEGIEIAKVKGTFPTAEVMTAVKKTFKEKRAIVKAIDDDKL